MDFGPDAHIAELAAKFCQAYALNSRTDRAEMAAEVPASEWRPHYETARDLIKKLEATEPKTVLGLALRCLGPIGEAGWNAPADGDTDGMDSWERVGARFADAVLAGALVPLPIGRGPIADTDLAREAFAYAYNLDLSRAPLDALLRLAYVFHREAEVLSDVAQEARFYPNLSIRLQNGGGEVIEAESNCLSCLRDACIMEMAPHLPKTEADRDATLVSRINHEMLCETKIRSKALLAEIREAWGGE